MLMVKRGVATRRSVAAAGFGNQLFIRGTMLASTMHARWTWTSSLPGLISWRFANRSASRVAAGVLAPSHTAPSNEVEQNDRPPRLPPQARHRDSIDQQHPAAGNRRHPAARRDQPHRP